MNKNSINRKLIRLNSDINTQVFLTDALKDAISDNDNIKLNRTLKELVITAETNALKTRDIAVQITGGKLVEFGECENRPKIIDMNDMISRDVCDITIAVTDEVLSVKLPSLALTYKHEKSRSLFVQPLINAFERHLRDCGVLPNYQNAVMVFENVIGVNQVITADNDNYNYRQLANIVASYLLADDDSSSCSFYYTSTFSEIQCMKSHTKIHVIPKHQFAKWISEQELYCNKKAA